MITRYINLYQYFGLPENNYYQAIIYIVISTIYTEYEL